MKKTLFTLVSFLIVLAFVSSACSPETTAPTEPPVAEEEKPAEEAGAAEEPQVESKVGGTFVWVVPAEPDTLDPHKTHSAVSDYVMSLLGTSLVAINPEGEIVPYAAESWTTSDDGLVWEFTLRQDITFHDGTPLKAQDFAWTFQRALAPETASPAAASMLGSMTAAEALDDYTLRLSLAEAYFPFLLTLSSSGYLQPLSQSAIEEMGEEVFARNPVGTGPYKMKDWLTGERVVLERNPDYNWGPAIAENTGSFNIETIEFRVIPEYATQIAGMESGEIDFMVVQTKDMEFFRDNPDFQIFERPLQGIAPYIALNLEVPPFDDVNVRKALNLALDRQAMVDVMLEGQGVIQYGPISESVIGYWPGVEEIGYNYDPDAAETYMEEAGFTRNTDGVWAKDGKVFYFPMATVATDEETARISQIVQEQLKRFGIEVELTPVDAGIYGETVLGGDFEVAIGNWLYPEADLLYLIFHSSMINALNVHRLNDPEMDALLEQTRTEVDPATRQEVVNEVQKKLVEDAIFIPLYTPVENYVVRSKVKDLIFSGQFGLFFNDAYIEE